MRGGRQEEKKLSVSCVPEKANLLIQLVVPKSEAHFRSPPGFSFSASY